MKYHIQYMVTIDKKKRMYIPTSKTIDANSPEEAESILRRYHGLDEDIMSVKIQPESEYNKKIDENNAEVYKRKGIKVLNRRDMIDENNAEVYERQGIKIKEEA